MSDARSGPAAAPSAGSTTALTDSPQSSSGIPNTATSATIGCMMIAASTSAG